MNYELAASAIVARLGGCRTCEKVQAVYHVTERPPTLEGCCDDRLFQREDDRPESIQVRLEAYDRSTAPLLEFYHKLGLLVQVTASGTSDEVFTRTLSVLESQRVLVFAHKDWNSTATAANRLEWKLG